MPYKFRKASCVAVGTFNIYIIQPAWLTAVGIFPSEAEVTLQANLTRPGFRLSSVHMKTVWYVAPGRLAVESVSPHQNCGELMATVLDKLLWTPVSAIGNNVTYQADREAAEPFPALDACAHSAVVPEEYSEKRRSLSLTVIRPDRDYTLTAVAGTEVVELTGNASVTFAEGHSEDTSRAADVARAFDGDLATMRALFVDVFGIDNLEAHVTSNP